jgi:hypothetical protein
VTQPEQSVGFSWETGTALPVRGSTQKNHCERPPFTTGADKHAVLICSAGVDISGGSQTHAPRQWPPFSLLTFFWADFKRK